MPSPSQHKPLKEAPASRPIKQKSTLSCNLEVKLASIVKLFQCNTTAAHNVLQPKSDENYEKEMSENNGPKDYLM